MFWSNASLKISPKNTLSGVGLVGEPWVKKEDGSFDVTMGAYDGTEVYELIGIYMLYLMGKKYDSKHIGLYDGLAAFKNVSRPASEKMKKQLQSLLKQRL